MTKSKNKIVYRMDYAFELMNRGHKVIGVMPNPKKPVSGNLN